MEPLWFVALLCALLALMAAPVSSHRDCYGAVVELQVNISSNGTDGTNISSSNVNSSVPRHGTVAGRGFSVYGYPAAFGKHLNTTATFPALMAWVQPQNACAALAPAPVHRAVGLVSRGNCSFSDKASAVQAAGFGAMVLVDDAADGGSCVLMWANHSEAADITIPLAAITHEAGSILQQLLAGGASATASLRQPDLPHMDVGATALWVLATGTVAAAIALAAHDQAAAAAFLPCGGGRKVAHSEEESRLIITAATSVWFVVISSAFLLVLFFFLSAWLALAMVWLFALGAWSSLAALLHEALAHAAPPTWLALRTPPLPLGIGVLDVLPAAASATSAVLALTWALCRDQIWAWMLQDLLAIALMLVILRQLLLPNLKVACILLPLAFLYDIWWVFLSPLIFHQSVMVVVATGGKSHEQLPMVLRMPHFSGLPLDNPAYSILGFGDVVLPGLLAVLCARWDASVEAGWRFGLALPCLAAYGTGLGLTYAALAFSWFGDQGQPALLYLVPCCLGTVALLAWRRGWLQKLWLADLDNADNASNSSIAGSSMRPVLSVGSLEAGEFDEYAMLASPTVGRGPPALPPLF